MTRLFLAAALCLAGCDDVAFDQSEARYALQDSERRIAELERRIADLEAEVADEAEWSERLVDASIKDNAQQGEEIRRLTENQEAFKANIDYLRALHGREEMPIK